MFKLNIFIVTAFFLLNVQNVWSISEEMQELANMLHKTCQEQTSVPEELIVNARKGDFSDDTSLKCYTKCIMAELAILDDDGKLDEEALIGMLPEEFVERGAKIVKKCGTIVGADLCDTCWLTSKCYQSEGPDIYYLP